MAKAKDRTSGVSAQQGAAENQQQPTGQPAFTPGPWKHGGPIRRESIIKVLTGSNEPNGLSASVYEVGAEGDRLPPGICVVNDYTNSDGEKFSAEANARLIAAAPDLLAACEALMAARLSVFDGGIVEQTEAERAAEKLAEQAIAKATGKAGGQ